MQTYVLNLVFHCLDVVFTWLYLFSQLHDLVVKNKSELFQLLIFLFQIIYFLFLRAKKRTNFRDKLFVMNDNGN